MKTNILNISFDVVSKNEALDKLLGFLKTEKNHILITPNPEIVMRARKDKEFFNIIQNSDLIVPDGIGILLASKLNKVKIKERVTGYDLVQSLFDKIQDTSYTVYFLGGAPGISEKAKIKMIEKYPNLKILGVRNGYFKNEDEKEIVKEIINLNPDILILGLGAPKQEKFAYKYKNILPVKLTCCVGGSFDAMSGNLKRPPEIIQKLGLEWFYRLIKQPSRIIRMLQLPLFVLIVIKEKIFKK